MDKSSAPNTPAGEQKEIFTQEDVEKAIQAWLDFGDHTFEGAHHGYFSGGGWAARVLRTHLENLKSPKKMPSPAKPCSEMREAPDEAALRTALRNTATRDDGDGRPCWCDSPRLRDGLYQNPHAACCLNARAALDAVPSRNGEETHPWIWSLEPPWVSAWRWIEMWDENSMSFSVARFQVGDELPAHVAAWRFIDPPKGTRA